MIYDQRIDRVENELDTVKEILMMVARRYEEGAKRQEQTDERIDRIVGAIDRLKPLQENTDKQLEQLEQRQEQTDERIDRVSKCLAEICLGCRDRINRSLDKSDELGDYAQCSKYFSKISVVQLIEYKAKVI